MSWQSRPKYDDVKKVQRLLEDKTMSLFRVRLFRPSHTDDSHMKQHDEYYVANDIRDVWAAIQIELIDESTEVESVERVVPVLAILSPTQGERNDQRTNDHYPAKNRLYGFDLGRKPLTTSFVSMELLQIIDVQYPESDRFTPEPDVGQAFDVLLPDDAIIGSVYWSLYGRGTDGTALLIGDYKSFEDGNEVAMSLHGEPFLPIEPVCHAVHGRTVHYDNTWLQ